VFFEYSSAMKPIIRVAFSLLFVSSTIHAQEDKSDQPAQAVASLGVVMQLVKTNGSEVFIEHDFPDTNAKAVPKVRTVMVPVQKVVVKDGKNIVVTSYRKQQFTYMDRPTKRSSSPMTKFHKFKDIDGKIIPKNKLIGRLGMGKGKYVVQLRTAAKINAELKKAFAKDTIFLYLDDSEE